MDPRYEHPEAARLYSREHTLRLWLRVEQTVATVQAEQNLIPREAAAAINRAQCPGGAAVDQAERRTGHDVAAFLTVLGRLIPDPERNWLHHGMTSSDLVDTANSIRMQQVTTVVIAESASLKNELRRLGAKHGDTYRAARTHGRVAEPTRFDAQLRQLTGPLIRATRALARSVPPMKLSGPVGHYTYNPPQVEDSVMATLARPADLFATQVVGRDQYATWAFNLVQLAQAVEGIATEIRLSAQSGVDELAEPFGREQVGSTAMPHKRNPVRSERLCGLARVARGLFLPVLETGGALWGERDISNSSVERTALRDLAVLVAWMLREAADLVAGLQVDTGLMADNLAAQLDLPTPAAQLWLAVLDGANRDEAYRRLQAGGRVTPDRDGHSPAWFDATQPGWYLRDADLS